MGSVETRPSAAISAARANQYTPCTESVNAEFAISNLPPAPGKGEGTFRGQRRFKAVADNPPQGAFMLPKSILAIVVTAALAAVSAGCYGPATGRADVLEERLGPCNSDEVRISPDGVHTAYALIRDGTVRIIHDGREGPAFSTAVGRNRYLFPVLSPDGARCAYTADVDGGQCVVVDGTVGWTHKSVGPLYFSPDGRHLAYVATLRLVPGKRLFVDGVPGPTFDEITIPTGPYEEGRYREGPFSPDGRRTLYVATQGSKEHAVIDGQPGPPYDQIYGLQFSPDSRRTAYRGAAGGTWRAVLDGREGPAEEMPNLYNLNPHFYWSPDGSRLAYEARRGGRTRMVVDGQDGPEYDYMMEIFFSERHRGCVFSQDSRHYAYAATCQPKDAAEYSFVVLDGRVVGTGYEATDFRDLRFEGDRLFYFARRGGKRLISLDGVEGPEFDALGSVQFTKTGGRLTYNGRRDDAWFTVEGGSERPAPADYLPPCQGPWGIPVGAHLAYQTRKGRGYAAVIDGRTGPEYERIRSVYVTVDGRSAYAAMRNNKWRMVIDGHEGPEFDGISGGCLFGPGGHSAYLVWVGQKWQVVADGVAGPEHDSVHDIQYIQPGSKPVLVYVAMDKLKWYVIANGQASPPADEIRQASPRPEPGAYPAHWVGTALRGGRWEVVVDGRTLAAYDKILWGPALRPDGKIVCFARRDGVLYKVTVEPGDGESPTSSDR
jgi:Tol biopolymer transport system component